MRGWEVWALGDLEVCKREGGRGMGDVRIAGGARGWFWCVCLGRSASGCLGICIRGCSLGAGSSCGFGRRTLWIDEGFVCVVGWEMEVVKKEGVYMYKGYCR